MLQTTPVLLCMQLNSLSPSFPLSLLFPLNLPPSHPPSLPRPSLPLPFAASSRIPLLPHTPNPLSLAHVFLFLAHVADLNEARLGLFSSV